MIRIFRSSAADYELLRAAIDNALGYPDPDTKTATAIPPASELPADVQGRVYLAVASDFCDSVPQIAASDSLEEIDEATYRAAVEK